ncbi:hypothetical protein OIU85_027346 [Salix viminalis]|uniref:Uncharacterized protein n=1 Tax=Salix viminalis TaxID=40686 RepID=A0A9Q0TAZ3_SALVM|nr:hypothetical protein OIU85_027346 [Salix viminalis]
MLVAETFMLGHVENCFWVQVLSWENPSSMSSVCTQTLMANKNDGMGFTSVLVQFPVGGYTCVVTLFELCLSTSGLD